METAMSAIEAIFTRAESVSIPARHRKSAQITRHILIAVLLFDLAGAGTIFGLGEAQAAQRHTHGLNVPTHDLGSALDGEVTR
jgi:hypothetical protein